MIELRFLKGVRSGERFLIEKGETLLLGRGPVCSCVIKDSSLSRRHCTIERTESDEVVVTDLGSKNGTFVNKQRISRMALKHGDKVVIGTTLIIVHNPLEDKKAPTCESCGEFMPRGSTETVCRVCRMTGQEQALPEVKGYRLLKRLGRGALGSVYEAEQVKLSRKVALKVFDQRYGDEAGRQRFFREANAAAILNHPNIVQIYGADHDGDICYIAMELVRGEPLSRMIKEEGQLKMSVALRIARQVASALDHAFSKGIVHRDIKPHNILVKPSIDVKIVDFGLAKNFKTAGLSGLTKEGQGLGSLPYMPPEQLDDAIHADQRSDIYSLGATLYHMLTGRPPYSADTVRGYMGQILNSTPPLVSDFNEKAPQALVDLVVRCMAKDKADRYQTPKELHDLLCRMEVLFEGFQSTRMIDPNVDVY